MSHTAGSFKPSRMDCFFSDEASSFASGMGGFLTNATKNTSMMACSMPMAIHSPCHPNEGTTRFASCATTSWASDTQITQMPFGRPRLSEVKLAVMMATLTMDMQP